jgi:hypothetical protein
MKLLVSGLATLAFALGAATLPPGADAAGPTDCQKLAAEIHSLEHQLADLAKGEAADLHGASPGEKAAIIKMYKHEKQQLAQELAQTRAELSSCVKKPIAHVPVTIRVGGLQCAVETDEVGADEPYALVYAVDLTAQRAIVVNGQPVSVPFPAGNVGLTGAWDDVDGGEYHSAAELGAGLRKPFWSLSGKPQVIENAGDVIFLVALMENDDGKPTAVRGALDSMMEGILAGKPTGDRAALVQQLIDGASGAIDDARLIATKGPNLDDEIGPVKELRLGEADLRYVAHMGSGGESLTFVGDGGKYRVDFALTAG